MFGKLMKYEMLSTARVFGICYLALLAVSLVLTISLGGTGLLDYVDTFPGSGNGGGTLSVAMVVLYGCLLVAVCVVTLIFIISRFQKNLLGSEGYLMMTLPVPTWELVLSKTVAALIWAVLSGVAIAASFFIIAVGTIGFAHIGEILAQFPQVAQWYFERTGMHISGLMAPVLLTLIFSASSMVLQIYFSIMVGSQVNKHKTLLAVVVFFAICVLLSAVNEPLSHSYALFNGIFGFSASEVKALWGNVAEGAVLSVVFFIGTTLLMKKRLNLE